VKEASTFQVGNNAGSTENKLNLGIFYEETLPRSGGFEAR